MRKALMYFMDYLRFCWFQFFSCSFSIAFSVYGLLKYQKYENMKFSSPLQIEAILYFLLLFGLVTLLGSIFHYRKNRPVFDDVEFNG